MKSQSNFTVQLSGASKGVVFSSMSFPYSIRPASSLSVSLAPSPTGFMPKFVPISSNLSHISVCEEEKKISNPSSPVYPVRAKRQSTSNIFVVIR